MISAVCATSWNRCRKRTTRERLPRVESLAPAEPGCSRFSTSLPANHRVHSSSSQRSNRNSLEAKGSSCFMSMSESPGSNRSPRLIPPMIQSELERTIARRGGIDLGKEPSSGVRQQRKRGHGLLTSWVTPCCAAEWRWPVMISTAPPSCHATTRHLSLSAIWGTEEVSTHDRAWLGATSYPSWTRVSAGSDRSDRAGG